MFPSIRVISGRATRLVAELLDEHFISRISFEAKGYWPVVAITEELSCEYIQLGILRNWKKERRVTELDRYAFYIAIRLSVLAILSSLIKGKKLDSRALHSKSFNVANSNRLHLFAFIIIFKKRTYSYNFLAESWKFISILTIHYHLRSETN